MLWSPRNLVKSPQPRPQGGGYGTTNRLAAKRPCRLDFAHGGGAQNVGQEPV